MSSVAASSYENHEEGKAGDWRWRTPIRQSSASRISARPSRGSPFLTATPDPEFLIIVQTIY